MSWTSCCQPQQIGASWTLCFFPTVFPFRLKLGVFLHGNLTGTVPPKPVPGSHPTPQRSHEKPREIGAHLALTIGALLQTSHRRKKMAGLPECTLFIGLNPRATNQKQPSAWLWAFGAWPWVTPAQVSKGLSDSQLIPIHDGSPRHNNTSTKTIPYQKVFKHQQQIIPSFP